MMIRRLANIVLLASAIAVAGCRDDRIQWVESAGDVGGDSSYRLLDYEITSERYRRWIAAHNALDGVELGEPMSIDLRRLTTGDIERVEESLESHAAARTSIEGAGLSVRDFVLTTIALAQPWAESQPGSSAMVNVAEPGPVPAPRGDGTAHRIRVRDNADSDSDSGRERKKKKRRG